MSEGGREGDGETAINSLCAFSVYDILFVEVHLHVYNYTCTCTCTCISS